MKRLLVGLLALIAATPAWAAKPDAATVIPKLVEAQASCTPQPAQTEVELPRCSLSATEAIWRAQDLDADMQKALSAYQQDMLSIAQAADARTISADIQYRRVKAAEQTLRQLVFGRGVRVTDPGLDPSHMPTREDLVPLFPTKAAAERKDGTAMMSCRVKRDGVLSACWIVTEIPPGYGFGQAAIALSKILKGTPATLNGQPIDGAEIRFALGFDPAWL
jgi:hypothetical protein